MILDLFRLVSKNFKLLLRTKTSILTLILAPVIIIFLLGLAFNTTNVYNIRVGVYSSHYTELADSLLSKLKEKEFTILKYDSEKECIERIKVGDSNICVVFPPDLAVEKGKTNNIVFHVDPSETNLVWLILDITSSEFSSKSQEISLDLTKALLDRLSNTKQKITEKSVVVEKLIENNIEMTNISNQIDAKIKTLSFKVSGNLSVETLKKAEDTSQSEVRLLKNYVKNEIINSKTKITTAKESAANLPNSTDKDHVISSLNSISLSLDNINTRLDKIDSLNKTEWKQINTQISQLGTNIEDTLQKMSAAEKAASDVTTKNNQVKQITDEDLARLNEVKSTFENIKSGVESIKIDDAGNIVNPITSTIKPIVEEKTHLNYIFSGIVMMIVMFVSILLASTVIVIEKKSKSYLINYLAPTSDITFVISMFLTIMMLMIMQTAVIIGISAYFYGSQILPNLGTISLILISSTALFVLIGMLIAYVFKAEQTITLITVSVGSTFMFLSDIILPIESMPTAFQYIVKFNPFLLSETLLKKTVLFGVGIAGIWEDLLLILALSFAIFIIILMVEKLIKRHTLFRLINWIFPPKKNF